MDYLSRISSLQKSLRRRKLDALIISQPENRRYLSGYTSLDHGIAESSGLLLIPRKGKPYLLTDFRFGEQAAREAKDYDIVLYPKGLFVLLKKFLPQLKIKKLGFESHYTLHSSAERLGKLCNKLGITLLPLTGIVENMRQIKTEEEIDLIRRAVRLNEKVFQKVFPKIDHNCTEIDISLLIAAEMRNSGAERESFETIVAAGAASSLPHAVPHLQKIQKKGPVVIDMGLILEGYCSDMTRSFYLGKVSKKYRKIHRVVRKAQLAGIAAVRAGVRGRDVDKAARKIIADAGYGDYFGHALGHGVGIAVHEEPRISPRGKKKLRAGMVITIEPGIYIPGWGGIRLEDMVVVREDGCENLNRDTTWLDI